MKALRLSALFVVAMASSLSNAYAAPAAVPYIEPRLSMAGGAYLSAEPGYALAPGALAQLRLALAVGSPTGRVDALLSGGAAYQAPSLYTAEWYRYRGFFGLTLGLGLRARLGLAEASLLAGGQLARYDFSYSYFWFPFVELGASLPLLEFGPGFVLLGGLELPVQLRADAFSAGLRAVVTLAFRPASQGTSR